MTGSIYQKSSNKKWYPYIYDVETHKKKWGTGFTNKRDAASELRKMLAQYDQGQIIFSKAPIFEDVFNEWFTLVAPEIYKSQCSIDTIRYGFSQHILPAIGTARIDKIDKMSIQRLLHAMKKTNHDGTTSELSAATKRKYFWPLSKVFDAAIEWGYISINPCANIKLKSPTSHLPDTWDDEQVNYFLNLSYVRSSKYYLSFLILATTGISRSELCGLRWKDFYGTYFILDRGKDRYGADTEMKTVSRHRKIDLMDITVRSLNDHREYQKRISRTISIAPDIVPDIITDEFNQPIRPERITKMFRAYLLRNNLENDYKLPDMPLKNLRHTFATLLINDNVNIKIVQEALGHSRTSTTQNFYQGAAQKSMHGAAISALERKIFNVPVENPVEKSKKA